MTVITGTIKNAAGELSDGILTVKANKIYGHAGAVIDGNQHDVDVVDGVFTTPDIAPGPVKLVADCGNWRKTFETVLPDQETIDFWDLVESTIIYEPQIVSTVVQARDDAQQAKEDAQSILDQVEAGVVPDDVVSRAKLAPAVRSELDAYITQAEADARVTAVGNATYAPASLSTSKLDTTEAASTYAKVAGGLLKVGSTAISASQVGAVPTLTRMIIPATSFIVTDGITLPTLTNLNGTPLYKFPRTTHISDTGTRADNASSVGNLSTGQTWTVGSGTWGILSNCIYNPSAGAGARINVTGAPVDGQVQAKFVALPSASSSEVMLMYRFTDSSNYVYVSVTNTGSVRVGHVVAGSGTQLGGVSSLISAGGTVALRAIGTTLSVYVNGVLIPALTVTTTITTGTGAGIRNGSDTNGAFRIQDFAVMDDGRASAVVPIPAHWNTYDVGGYFTNLGAATGWSRWRYSECGLDLAATTASMALSSVNEFTFQTPSLGAVTPFVFGTNRTVPASRMISMGISRVNSHAEDSTVGDLALLCLTLVQNT